MYCLEKKYPVIEINLKKLRHNIDEIVKRCKKDGIEIAAVVKGFNGIPRAMKLYNQSGCKQIASSRLEHLAMARKLGISGPFLAIRIPMMSEIPDLVSLADMSLNSELAVIKAIDAECHRRKKYHGIILMADLGDLREGFWDKEEIVRAAVYIEKELKHVYLAGVGTNLGCYGSIHATPQKMEELIAVAQAIEEAIGRKLEIISGGGTLSLPLVIKGTMPDRINHLRLGEGIILGRDLQEFWNLDMSFLYHDVFTLKAEIIEIKDKPSYPVGEIFVNCFGKTGQYIDRGTRKRAILAVGKVDFALDYQLYPRLSGVEILGSSSDHLIVDIQENRDDLAVGDILEFDLQYSTMLYLTNSRYVRIDCKE